MAAPIRVQRAANLAMGLRSIFGHKEQTAVETDSSGAFLDRPDAEPRATEPGCSGDLLGRTRNLARPER
jgi:hypothetical protein